MKVEIKTAQTSQHVRRTAGGAATGGGMNFQAAVTAIAYVHMAGGHPLRWLDTLVDDVPTAIEAETGGAGDDLRLLLKDALSIEVQVKKGLQSGTDLWDALLKLARAVTTGMPKYGVLVVSPCSSRTITKHLATDVIRIGDGRTDNLAKISGEFIDKLKQIGIQPHDACSRLRIKTVSATALEQESVSIAHAYLTHLCMDPAQVIAAWDAFYADATRLIEQRRRREISSLLCVLKSSGIVLADLNPTAPAILLNKLAQWTLKIHATFSIFGIDVHLNIDDVWIPLTAIVREEQAIESSSLAEELQRYQTWENRSISRDARYVDPETIGRFIPRAIIVAGPGMGKTTLLKRIARRYSEDFIPVLRIRLSAVAARMRGGASFEESIFHLGLDGSGISVADTQRIKLSNWLLLCDGLDECGSSQEDVADGVARFAVGHPNCRILITTRPVGFHVAHFHDWQHYELPALDPGTAPVHAASLVESIVPPGHDLHNNAREICQQELGDTAAAKVVGRTPLLLGLAAAIIAHGKKLSASREHIFKQLFELIDRIPNARTSDNPATITVLRHFIGILGWEMTHSPLSPVNETIGRCADHLARELGTGQLAAMDAAERYLNYWQDIGMIERVGHDNQHTLSFIHKNFGEFAAAQRLCSISQCKQTDIVAGIVGVPAWTEVLRFAGMMGLADLVTDYLLMSSAMDTETENRIRLAIELTADAAPPPDQTRRKRIIEEALRVAASDRRLRAFEVGLPLVAAARRFPDEVSPAASIQIHSEHAWTRLIAWACLVAAGPKYYSIDDLVGDLQSCVDAAGPFFQATLGGGIDLGNIEVRTLTESFALEACAIIIDRIPAGLADTVVPAVLNHPNVGSTTFIYKAYSMLQNSGKHYKIKAIERITKFPGAHGYSSEAWQSMLETISRPWLKLLEVIATTLDLSNPTHSSTSPPIRPLLHLSALIKSSMLDEFPASDTLTWTESLNNDATHATLQAFIAICETDIESLKLDISHAIEYLHSNTGTKNSLFDLIIPVDPAPINWPIVKSLALDVTLIEKAVLHHSQWITYLAANILGNYLEPNALELVIKRLFDTGKDHTLWAACALASGLDQQHALSLALERLAKPLVNGCEYLFDLLRKREDFQPEILLEPTKTSLLTGDTKIALAAARLAAKVAVPGLNDFIPILKEAYIHWLAHEESYPTKGGIIPDSPRANILEALMKIRSPSYEEIKPYLLDQRGDVREIGVNALVQHLRRPDGNCLEFIKEVEAGDLPDNLLGKVLTGNLSLNEDEICSIECLLNNPSKHIRYGSMALLTEHYLTPDQIRIHATAMSSDSEQGIRDRAFSILDTLQDPVKS